MAKSLFSLNDKMAGNIAVEGDEGSWSKNKDVYRKTVLWLLV